MLAEPADWDKVRYPLFVSPKIDGVRGIVVHTVLTSRSGETFPNLHAQRTFSKKAFEGFDGEFTLGPAYADNVFRVTNAAMASHSGEPDLTYWVFDEWSHSGPFWRRFECVERYVNSMNLPNVKVVPHTLAHSRQAVEECYLTVTAAGYEGVMLRDPEGPYKNGRSTINEGWLLKVKKVAFGEALILDMEELQHNDNEDERSALGYAKRSSHQANLRPGGVMGKLYVRDLESGVEFRVGTGFTADDRAFFWENYEKIRTGGFIIRYKWINVGIKDKPRSAVYLGIRVDDPNS